jgi:hypothetical protein
LPSCRVLVHLGCAKLYDSEQDHDASCHQTQVLDDLKQLGRRLTS